MAGPRAVRHGALTISVHDTDVDRDEPRTVTLATPAGAERWLAARSLSWVRCDGSSEQRCLYDGLAMAEGRVPPSCGAGCYGVPPHSFTTSHRTLYVRSICFVEGGVSSIVIDDGD